jgi:hypothetical protein
VQWKTGVTAKSASAAAPARELAIIETAYFDGYARFGKIRLENRGDILLPGPDVADEA